MDHDREEQRDKPVEGLVRRMFFRACDLRLRDQGATPKVAGRPLTRVEVKRLVAYARKWAFLPPE